MGSPVDGDKGMGRIPLGGLIRSESPYSRDFRSPSMVGINSVTVGWMCMTRWITV